MNAAPYLTSARLSARNRRTGWIVFGVVMGMLGLSFAAVPLYDLFCRTTGFGGTPMVASKPADRLGTRIYTVRFDAGVNPALPWRFEAEASSIQVRPGEVKTVTYKVRNISASETVGIASFNVLPEITGGYFNKLQCFCFTDVTLKPGETREESVVFFLDPDIENTPGLSHVDTITLSYTFFPSKTPTKPIAANEQTGGSLAR
ncbi:MAG TPA: cytochrome c oxidase assembly protein [Beijerinckiaceae bacterium]|nr:cytochrome c oxidase assembly protein [Beijerinckiaceae bacterium]